MELSLGSGPVWRGDCDGRFLVPTGAGFSNPRGFSRSPPDPCDCWQVESHLSSRTESVSKMAEPPGGAAGGDPGESVDARSSCDQPAQDQTKVDIL